MSDIRTTINDALSIGACTVSGAVLGAMLAPGISSGPEDSAWQLVTITIGGAIAGAVFYVVSSSVAKTARRE